MNGSKPFLIDLHMLIVSGSWPSWPSIFCSRALSSTQFSTAYFSGCNCFSFVIGFNWCTLMCCFVFGARRMFSASFPVCISVGLALLISPYVLLTSSDLVCLLPLPNHSGQPQLNCKSTWIWSVHVFPVAFMHLWNIRSVSIGHRLKANRNSSS